MRNSIRRSGGNAALLSAIAACIFGRAFESAKVGLRALAPLVGERLAAGAANVDLQQRPGHGIEAGGEDEIGRASCRERV